MGGCIGDFGEHEEPLTEPKGARAELLRRLAEAAMSVTHHDAANTEDGYIHEVRDMERKFSKILHGKLKPKWSATRAALTAQGGEPPMDQALIEELNRS